MPMMKQRWTPDAEKWEDGLNCPSSRTLPEQLLPLDCTEEAGEEATQDYSLPRTEGMPQEICSVLQGPTEQNALRVQLVKPVLIAEEKKISNCKSSKKYEHKDRAAYNATRSLNRKVIKELEAKDELSLMQIAQRQSGMRRSMCTLPKRFKAKQKEQPKRVKPVFTEEQIKLRRARGVRSIKGFRERKFKKSLVGLSEEQREERIKQHEEKDVNDGLKGERETKGNPQKRRSN